MFKKYPKIHRLGKEETDGILEGVVHIEEKIDGANVSIWCENGELQCGSRSQRITEGFNGFVDYVKSHPTLPALFATYPHLRLYGEWLVRHTIAYKETAYKQFYLFDVTSRTPETDADPETREELWPKMAVHQLAKDFDLLTPFYHGEYLNPTLEDIMPSVGKSVLGERGEGVVLKNPEFRDKFGNHNYAKIVTESFKEDNGVTFGGNNKHSDSYWEMYVVNKYMTLARIEKIMNKLQPIIDNKLDLEHIPRISNTAYHDMLTEEIWEIAGKVQKLDFNILKRVAMKKAVQIYKDIITGDISVADRKN